METKKLNWKPIKAMSAALLLTGLTAGQSASAAQILFYLEPGNDGINPDGSEQLDGLLGFDVSQLDRVEWDFSDGITAINPQTAGGLTITGTAFKLPDDPTEAVAGTWEWDSSFGSLDYLTFKFDSWLAVYQITDGMTSGTWDLAALCTDYNACNLGGNTAALSHSAGYSVVPVPAAVWLFGSGLLGLAGFARKRKTS